MNKWWERKKEQSRKRRKNNKKYTLWDFTQDVLFSLPELIILPFRIIFWSSRSIGRLIGNLFDIV